MPRGGSNQGHEGVALKKAAQPRFMKSRSDFIRPI
jgi:hypothetical protein